MTSRLATLRREARIHVPFALAFLLPALGCGEKPAAPRVVDVAAFKELASRSVLDNLRPKLVGFPKRNCVGVTNATISAKRLVRHFGYVRPADHDRHTDGADRIGHAISFGDHSSHGTDADEIDTTLAYEPGQAFLIHVVCVAINQQNFVAGRCDRL